jgi:heterodisulfide reductase subunit C
MTDFGFGIHEDLMVDHDSLSPAYEAVLEEVPSIVACMACGSCSGTCVSSFQSGTGFRKLIMLLKNGSYDRLQRALDYCQFCGKCSLVCPRGINTRKAILEMRKYFKNQGNDVI